jgi:hypothetical protein
MAHIASVLEPQARDLTATALQQTLTDLIDLGLVAKHTDWTVTGARFRTLHQQLDEVVDTARVHADTIAERAAALGVAPDGRVTTVAADSGYRSRAVDGPATATWSRSLSTPAPRSLPGCANASPPWPTLTPSPGTAHRRGRRSGEAVLDVPSRTGLIPARPVDGAPTPGPPE